MSIMEMISETLEKYDSIGLDQLDEVRLMNRHDLKYLFPVQIVPELLSVLEDRYRVLEIGDMRGQEYETLYYDTDDLDMYRMHHRGKRERHKVRFRRYTTSDTVFLEVKRKDNKGVTDKSRVQCEGAERFLLSEEEEFLSTYSPFEEAHLHPVIRNSFRRITLISKEEKERITIDFDLQIQKAENGQGVDLRGISVAEVKREGPVRQSPLSKQLHGWHIRPSQFSKYCIGVAKLIPGVPFNRFKELLRRVDRINEKGLNEHSIKNTL